MIFTHGSNINFHQSACEMSPSDLHKLLTRYVEQAGKLLVGTIDLTKQELYQFGQVVGVHVNDAQFTCTYHSQSTTEPDTISHTLDTLVISHEARFDVINENEQTVSYEVAYVTFHEKDNDEEKTYFIANVASVNKPLDYVAAFWEQVAEVGRDADFSITGCSAHDFSKKLAEAREQAGK